MQWLPCSACQRRADPQQFAAREQRLLGDEHVKEKEFADALTAYSKAISILPKDATSWVSRAGVYQELQDWQQALRDATRAVTLAPESEKAIYSKVLALHKLGKVEDALRDCQAGAQLHAKSRAFQDLLKALREEADRKAEKTEKAEKANAKPASKPQPREEASKKPEAASAKPASKPQSWFAEKKKTIDYSKWDNLEDSDDEATNVKEDKAKVKKWDGPNPSLEERLGLTEDMLEVCRKSYRQATTYFGEGKDVVKTKLPSDHQKTVGVLTVKELAKYKCSNDRMLVSIYGDIYDVSSRPDVYGYGPKSAHAGKDITWGVVVGEETEGNFNRFYDIFKLDEDHTKRYMQIICQRMVCFEEEFGEAVGRLEPFVNERDLPLAPKEEIEECKQQ